jgi:O-acetyl-ADP-ribose deacetylase (regulator of RNase III)
MFRGTSSVEADRSASEIGMGSPKIVRGGHAGEEEILRRCYRSVLALARARRFGSIALPSIGTGAFDFPPVRASRIAMNQIAAVVREDAALEISVVCFDPELFRAYAVLAS